MDNRKPLTEARQIVQSVIHKNNLTESEIHNSLYPEDELVQYFIVNSELNMSAGKIAAQVAHVATNITYKLMTDKNNENIIKWNNWQINSQPKVILRGKHNQLVKLIEEDWEYIYDNGRTEIPEGSLTVVGFTPEYKSIMRPIVKRFQLL